MTRLSRTLKICIILFIGLLLMAAACNQTAPPAGPSDQTLMPDSVFVSEDEVVLATMEGSLEQAVEVFIDPVTAPEVPLPATVRPLGEFFRFGANQDTYGEENPFVVALPVPEEVDTSKLALGILLQPEDVTESDLDRPFWQIVEGVYDAESGYFITTLPFLAEDGRIVVLLATDSYTAPNLNPIATLEGQQLDTEYTFRASCVSFDDAEVNNRSITCNATDRADLKTALDTAFQDYDGLGFVKPYLRRSIDASLSSFSLIPPRVNVVLTSEYQVELRPFRDVDPGEARWPCGSDGSITNLGGYSSGSQSFFVCIGNGGVDTRAVETARHEYFHAVQFGYSKVRSQTKPLWVLEGTAVASENSLATMIRDTGRAVRPVDVRLTAEGTPSLIEYLSQDFFVFAGQELGEGLDYLRQVFTRGARTQDVDAGLKALGFNGGLPEMYWRWAKNQAFEKRHDLGGTFNTTACAFDNRTATPDIIDYTYIAAPNNRTIGLQPLQSKVVRINLAALPGEAYEAQLNVTTSSSAVKAKLYDSGNAGSTVCHNQADGRDYTLSVAAGQSRTVYILISNTSLSASASVTLEFPSAAPTLEIQSPAANAIFDEGDEISFRAVATGFKGVNPDRLSISWRYTRPDDVPFTFATSENGETISRNGFCDGSYTVTAEVLNASGSQTASATVNFTVRDLGASNPPPQCAPSISIVEPAADSTFAVGQTIPLRAVFSDDSGSATPRYPIIWRLDGADGMIIGTGPESATKRGAGGHVIYVSYGAASDTVIINVIDTTASPPTATITSPEDGATFQWFEDGAYTGGHTVTVTGTGVSDGGATLPGSALTWAIRLQGSSNWSVQGTGNTRNIDFPWSSCGWQTWEIRLEVKDAEGLSGFDFIEISVQPPPC